MSRVARRLPLVGILLVVFTVAYGAAAQLDMTVAPVPQAASRTPAACQTDAVQVGYRVHPDHTSVTGMTVTGISSACAVGARLVLALQPSSLYFDGRSTQTLELTSGTAPAEVYVLRFVPGPIPVGDFTTGTVTVVIESTTGTSVEP